MNLALVLASQASLMATLIISEFGVQPNVIKDSTAAVQKVIDTAKPGDTIMFPPGEYHFHRSQATQRNLFISNSDVANPRHIAILIDGKKDLKLVGNGAKLIFHDRVMPFAILSSQRISLEGFTVDWKRPLMSQALVTESDRNGVTVQIDGVKFPYTIENERLAFTDATWKNRPWGWMEFEPANGGVAPNTGDAGVTDGDLSGARARELKPGVVRLDFANKRGPKVGNVLVIRHGRRDHAGTFVLDSKDIKFSDMAYRHTSGLGVIAQYTENLEFKNVQVAPDPASGRMFAGHDDGFHFSNCKGKILVDGCTFEGLMDDPINTHGTCVRIIEKLSPTIVKCRFMHDQSVGLRFGDPGDQLAYINNETLLNRGFGKLKSKKTLSVQEFEIEVSAPIPDSVKAGDALENLTWTPSLTVRNSVFGRVRARGLLISTPKRVLVENNTFRSSGAAILVAGDANYWYESGAVRDVTIRRNRFENCNSSPYQFGDAIISIHPEVPKAGSEPFHHNIKIENNHFETFCAPVLWAKSVRGLTFRGNVVNWTQAAKPWQADPHGLTLLDCEEVQVNGNRLGDGFGGLKTRVEGGRPESVVISGWK